MLNIVDSCLFAFDEFVEVSVSFLLRAACFSRLGCMFLVVRSLLS